MWVSLFWKLPHGLAGHKKSLPHPCLSPQVPMDEIGPLSQSPLLGEELDAAA